MKNENKPSSTSVMEKPQTAGKMTMGAEKEVERKDGIKAEQHSPMTNGNQHRSTQGNLPKLERRRDIF